MLLEHVFTCAHLSDGRYWCFHCQKEERFAPFQCKHCQVPAFRKDRLSTRAKRIFRWLGTKSHLKDHQAFNQSAPLNGTPCTFRNQCFEYLPEYRDISPTATEMEDHQVLRDLGADDKSGLAELNGSSVLPAELSGYSASTSKLHDSSLGSKDLRYPTNDEGGASVPYYASLDAIQAHALPTPSFDIREPLSQFPFKSSKPGASEDSLMQLLSPVSPQNADRISASYADTMSESPTDTDFSGMSSFTKSFDSNISPPSTRNSTMQSFSQSSLTAERPSECLSTLPIMHDIMNEMPSDMPEEDFYCAELASGIPGDAFPSAERQVSIHIGSPHWLTSKDLLNNLWKVLTLHVKESSERLSTLPDSPVISHLLSMTADTIASTGFSVWQGTLNGCLPATIPDLYALVHVAYACAIVIYDGQVENQVRRLFTHSLSIDSGALPDEDKSTYTNIVWSIWSPGSEDVHLHPFTSAKHNSRPIRPPNGPPWVKGKAPLHLVGVSELVTQSSHMQESVGTMESHSHRGNEILNVLAHFLDSTSG
jgi:hypothetical protein